MFGGEENVEGKFIKERGKLETREGVDVRIWTAVKVISG